jgi:putative phosphoribosyl transferase
MTRFRDRFEAGRVLGELLHSYAGRSDVLVLALPRGGVPVGFEVASKLGAPLDVFVVRKLGTPGHEELAMGAIATGGVRVLNEEVVQHFKIPEQAIMRSVEREERELARQEQLFRGSRGPPRIEGRTVILVDDGLATGTTMRAALRVLRQQEPARIVAAVPVGAPETCRELQDEADEVICATTPEFFFAVGQWYEDFTQTSDTEVHELLERAAREREVRVAADHEVLLEGTLHVPESALGVVLFAHGSGSSRFSPRNRYVASILQHAGLATLLIDLLTSEEEESERWTRHLRFDIELLAQRLIGAKHWLREEPRLQELPIGLFGSSTGAGAALVAAAREPEGIGAVVSRGGRPDLAREALPHVRAPTLLIVGGDDAPVIPLNLKALDALRTVKRLEIVPGASHLFEEPGTLEQVARLARDWFLQQFAVASCDSRAGEAPLEP